MAIFGPFERIINIPGLSWSRRRWYRQKPITDAPLTYYLEGYRKISEACSANCNPSSHTGWAVSTFEDGAALALYNQIYQKAYGRLMQDLSSIQSQLGADIGERKQAMNSMLARVGQLTKAARALRRGNVVEFVSSLGLYTTNRKRSVRRTAADLGGVWLEFSYGWVPLVKDIYSAVQVLQKPWPNRVIKGKAQGKYHLFQPWPYSQWYVDTMTYDWHLRCHLQTRVSVDNYYAWKANELGLLNPLSIAWELVPFSFVVDWFVPIGNYLQGLTDFVGLSLTNSFVSKYGTLDRIDYHFNKNRYNWAYDYTRHDRRIDFTRTLSLPAPPKLKSRFTGFYSVRGANAIALLTTTLKDLPNVKTPGRRFKMSRDLYNWDRNTF